MKQVGKSDRLSQKCEWGLLLYNITLGETAISFERSPCDIGLENRLLQSNLEWRSKS